VFTDDVSPDRLETDKIEKIKIEISIKQDPDTTNERARLYIHILLISVLKEAGLRTSLSTLRKNTSWRDSTITINDTDLISKKSIDDTRSINLIIMSIPTEITISLKTRN